MVLVVFIGPVILVPAFLIIYFRPTPKLQKKGAVVRLARRVRSRQQPLTIRSQALQSLIALLGHGSEKVRSKAEAALEQLADDRGLGGSVFAVALVSPVKDAASIQAIDAVPRLRTKVSEALIASLGQATSGNNSMLALLAFGDKSLIEPVTEALKKEEAAATPSWNLRRPVLEALAKMGDNWATTKIRALEKQAKELRAKEQLLAQEKRAEETVHQLAPALTGPAKGAVDKLIAVLDNIYLVGEEQAEQQLRESLDKFLEMDGGDLLLMSALFKDLSVVGGTLRHPAWGDYTWNEWLKRRELIRALARSGSQRAVPQLKTLHSASSSDAQFEQIMRPALADALASLSPEAMTTAATAPKSSGPRCKVCGRDLSKEPAVRDNLTGDMFCYEHRDQVGRV